MKPEDETARWSIHDRLELVELLGEIRSGVARIEAEMAHHRAAVDEMGKTVDGVSRTAQEANMKVSRLYWLGGALGSILALKDKVASLF